MEFLGGLLRAALDGEVGAQFVECGVEVLFAMDRGVGFGLQAAIFAFEGFEAVTGRGEFAFKMFAAFGGGAFAVFEVAAFPTDVFGLGFEVFHFAGGEAELALQGRELDLLALEAFAGNFDFFAQAFEVALEIGHAGAGGLVGFC